MDLDGSESENFIFGNVQHPPKRNRLGEPHLRSSFFLNSTCTVQGEPGKPPPGYKCRRCESTEVSLCCRWNLFEIYFGSQHFINDCPERTKPPDNYVCKICHEVSGYMIPLLRRPDVLFGSLVILYETVLREMKSAIQVARNPDQVTFAVHVEARITI